MQVIKILENIMTYKECFIYSLRLPIVASNGNFLDGPEIFFGFAIVRR